MIVSCPSCQTRYRYEETGSSTRRGRCSRCDESVDLAHRSRQYRLLPTATPLAAGMDDPALAPQLAGSGRAASSGVEMLGVPRRTTHRVLREWSGLLLLTALGAAAGFHAAVITASDPLQATAAGTVGGLLLGWSWIRAAERIR